MIIKKEVAEVLTAREEYEKAAKVLEKIDLDHKNEKLDKREKVDILLTIADNWFSADDSINAEKFVKKAAHEIHKVT